MFPELARDDVFRLETRRLWLRWPRAADAPDISELAGDSEVARMTATLPHPYRVDDAETFIRDSREDASRGEALRFVVTDKSFPRTLLGAIGVEKGDGGPQLGYWLGRPFWGRGYASEAAAAMTDAFFLVTQEDQLGATVLAENAASRSVLENLGFAQVENLDSGPERLAGNTTPRFALRRRDWQAQSDAACGFVRAPIEP
jgi:RimJ/RimL family protein N-acetyltransferase